MKILWAVLATIALTTGTTVGQTYDNGGMDPRAGGCNGGWYSAWESPSRVLGNNTLVGVYHQADDFVVPEGQEWTPTRLTWYLYQTSSPPLEPITAVFIQLWSGTRSEMLAGAATFVGGDMTTNRRIDQTFTNIYRVMQSSPTNCDRAIKEVEVDMSWVGPLASGQYWIEIGSTGNPEYLGPWANHVVPRDGQENSIFYTVATNTWAVNSSNEVGWDYPFKLHYTGGGGFTIALSGLCPGTKTLDWSGAGRGPMGILFGDESGRTTVPRGSCQGTLLGIQGRVGLFSVINIPRGEGRMSITVGPAACGRFVQCIKTDDCALSNVAGPI